MCSDRPALPANAVNPAGIGLPCRVSIGLVLMLCVCWTRSPGCAQRTWIVDLSGAAGSHFRQIQPAIDSASQGDLILIRPGSGLYAGFVATKGLTIMCELRGWAIGITSSATIRGVPRGERFVLKRLVGYGDASLILEDNAGSVYVEKCQTGFQGGELIVRRSSSVCLNQVDCLGARIESSYVTFNRGLNGSEIAAHPLLFVSSSIVAFGNSILRGSRANYDLFQCRVLVPPGDAIAGYDSLLVLGAGTSILGGRLSVSGGSCPPISLEAAAIRGSNVHVIKDPAATLGIVSGTVTVQTAAQPTLDGIVGDESAGRMDLELRATPNAATALVASLPADPILTPIGFQWANLAAHLVADAGMVDWTGRRSVSFLFPGACPLGQTMVFQSLVLDPGGLQWSTPSAIVRN